MRPEYTYAFGGLFVGVLVGVLSAVVYSIFRPRTVGSIVYNPSAKLIIGVLSGNRPKKVHGIVYAANAGMTVGSTPTTDPALAVVTIATTQTCLLINGVTSSNTNVWPGTGVAVAIHVWEEHHIFGR